MHNWLIVTLSSGQTNLPVVDEVEWERSPEWVWLSDRGGWRRNRDALLSDRDGLLSDRDGLLSDGGVWLTDEGAGSGSRSVLDRFVFLSERVSRLAEPCGGSFCFAWVFCPHFGQWEGDVSADHTCPLLHSKLGIFRLPQPRAPSPLA
jgi:hypothetical protein